MEFNVSSDPWNQPSTDTGMPEVTVKDASLPFYLSLHIHLLFCVFFVSTQQICGKNMWVTLGKTVVIGFMVHPCNPG